MLDFINELTFGQWMILGLIFFVVNWLTDKICDAIGVMFSLRKGKDGVDGENINS